VDYWLHGNWSVRAFNTWAPGVRLDTWLMHALAALFLWRLLARLRFSETRAFFTAMLFACHPVVCETVCWVSERKNAMAGMFGFAALWMQAFALPKLSSAQTQPGAVVYWRWPVVCILFALALLGKPSALGLFPIMVLIEMIVLFPSVQARLFGTNENCSAPSRAQRAASFAGIAALGTIAFACVRVNLYTHTGDLVAPPGGTVFTALLTDLEIFSRYLFNFVCPVSLSAMYYVEPIKSLGDSRVWMYGAVLAGSVWATIHFARNKWVAAFGWFWFFAALATNANVIAIVHWMQDRYVYLSAPGLWIALSECAAGVIARYGDERSRRTFALRLGAMVSVACIIMSSSRGYLWSSMFKLSYDATLKQPQSFFAHYGLGSSLNPELLRIPPGSPEYKERKEAWRSEFIKALECPDAERYNYKQWVGAELGKDAFANGNAEMAERYYKIGAKKCSLAPDFLDAHVISLAYLCMLDLYYKRDPDLALEKARESMRLEASDYGRFALGNALIACSQANQHATESLLTEARNVLGAIDPKSGVRADADELLKSLNEKKK